MPETVIAVGAIIGAAAAIGQGVYSGVEGQSVRKEAKQAAAVQSQKQDELLKEKKDQAYLSSQTALRDQQRAALNAKNASEAQAKGGTILTSPLGALGNAYGGGKTVLGG